MIAEGGIIGRLAQHQAICRVIYADSLIEVNNQRIIGGISWLRQSARIDARLNETLYARVCKRAGNVAHKRSLHERSTTRPKANSILTEYIHKVAVQQVLIELAQARSALQVGWITLPQRTPETCIDLRTGDDRPTIIDEAGESSRCWSFASRLDQRFYAANGWRAWFWADSTSGLPCLF